LLQALGLYHLALAVVDSYYCIIITRGVGLKDMTPLLKQTLLYIVAIIVFPLLLGSLIRFIFL